jgi:ABC-type glycerol-3-phosphate transport system permease component
MRKKLDSHLRIKREVISWVLILLVISGAILVFLPFVWMFLTSLKRPVEIQRVPFVFLPDSFLNFQNYIDLFKRQPFHRYLGNTFFVSGVSTLTSLIFSAMAGYGFAKFNFRGKEFWFFGIICLLMVPFQAIVIPLYQWVVQFGLINTYLGLMLPHLISAFGVFLMREAIANVPDDYIDAARIDGSSEIGIFFRIILPMVKPSLAALAIIKFLWTWNEFFWPLVITNTEEMKMVTLGLAAFSNMYYVEYNLVTTAALISILPVLLLFLAFQKWVVKAVVMSGVKG